MQTVPGLRRSVRGSLGGRLGAVPALESPAGLAAFVALVAFLLVVPRLGSVGETPVPAPPDFLAATLGAPQPDAPLESRPADGVAVGLTPSGYAVSLDAGASAALVFETAGEWQRFEGGAFRPTAFGSETVTIGPRLTEQYLTVERRQGLRTWRWRIDAPGLEPALSRSGRVDLVSSAGTAELFIPAVAVYDIAGRDVTPAGLSWSLEERNGAWWLELELDDAALPLPYVIDPGIGFRAASSAQNGTGALTLAIPVPAGVAEGDLLLAQVSTRGGTGTTITAPAGWTLVASTTNGTALRQSIYRHVAALPEPASYTWSFNVSRRAAGGMVAYGGVETSSPIDAWSSRTGSGTTVTANGVTTTDDDTMLAAFYGIARTVTFTPPGGMTERYDVTSSGSGSATAKVSSESADAQQPSAGATGSKSATASASTSWVAHLVALAPDTTSPALSADAPVEVSGAGNQHFDGATQTHWFNPAGSGSFSLAATASDTSGVKEVEFPDASAVSGWAGSAGGDDTSAPYASPVDYAWTAGASAPGSLTVTAEDYAGNTATDTITVEADSTAPAGQTVALSGGPWYTSLSVPLVLAGGSDAESGVDASSGVVERDSAPLSGGSCGAFSGSWTPVTLSGGADTNVSSGNCYRYRYTISDNVGNVSAPSASSGDALVDTSAPAAPALALAESSAGPDQHVSGTTLYYRPGAAGGTFVVTATPDDPDSGIAQVDFPAILGVVGGADVSSPLEAAYTWDSLTIATGLQSVTATNGAGLTGAAAGFTLVQDVLAPGGGFVDYADGPSTSSTVTVTTADGADAGSGVDASSGVVERRTTVLVSGLCAPFVGAWAAVTSPDTLASGLCAEYRYTVSDNVGNAVTYTSSNVVQVDAAGPYGGWVDYPDGWDATGSVTVTTDPGSDAESGIDLLSAVLERSTAALAGGACGAFGAWAPVSSPDTVASGECARYRYTIADLLGNATTYTSSNVVAVDTSAPAAAMTDPGTILSGTVGLGATADDPESGVATVTYEASPAGAGSWTAVPWSWDTTAVADGLYDLRVVVTNGAGLQTESATVADRLVDNTGPGGSGVDPGDYLSGTVTLTATPDDSGGSGVVTVTFQYRPSGSGPFTDVGTDADGSDGWSVDWDTTAVSDGDVDLQAVATDAAANETTISLGTKTVDNTAPTASVASGPADPSATASAALFLSADETGATFECALDGSAFAACSSPALHAGLAEGAHVFEVRATDPAGNVGASVSYAWTIELPAAPPPPPPPTTSPAPAPADTGEGGPSEVAGVATESPLLLEVVVPRSFTWKRGNTVTIRILLSRAARVHVTFAPAGKRRLLSRWATLDAGATVLKIEMPRQARKPGRYVLDVTAFAPPSQRATDRATILVRRGRK